MGDREDRGLERVRRGAAALPERTRGTDRTEPWPDLDPGADGSRSTAPTIRLGARDRGLGLLVLAIGLFLAIAWIKPWPSSPATRAPQPELEAATGPTPRPTADPLSSLKHHCQEPSGWRVYARERWGGRDLRSWRTMDPARAASGPLDPGIPVVPLGAQIANLGYCSPWNTAERPPAEARATAWRLLAGRNGTAPSLATEITLRLLAPEPLTAAAALFAAPSEASGGNVASAADWAAGRWVFAVRAAGYERWWAIDIRPPPPSSGDPQPMATAAPSGG